MTEHELDDYVSVSDDDDDEYMTECMLSINDSKEPSAGYMLERQSDEA